MHPRRLAQRLFGLCFVFPIACGGLREDGTSAAPPGPERAPETEASPAPATPRGEGYVGLNLSVAGGGAFSTSFYRERHAPRAGLQGCALEDSRDIPDEKRREINAGRLRMFATSDDKPVVLENLWDASAARYVDGNASKLRPSTLGRLRFVAEGADVPAFETELEPLRSLSITDPADGASIPDDDLVVRWATDENAAGVVGVRLGGWSTIYCAFSAGVRAVTVSRALVRAAVASRDEQLSAGDFVMVYLVRGRSLAVGDFDVSVNTSIVDERRVKVAP